MSLSLLSLLTNAGGVIELPSWAPDPDDVAALLLARTGRAIDDDRTSGPDRGTFTEDTTPTAEQVDRLIAFAVIEVIARVGAPIVESQQMQAQLVATIRAAYYAELATVPEGASDSDRSAATNFALDYERRIPLLRAGCAARFTRLA